ncbi:MAG TPA: M48 family metallopeptidase [Ignavibacteriaceae bacterium]|nr:M48 family metallopeptidase [Ignavibacteriaceae bacterium]
MMWELIQANKRKSIFIFIGMGLLLILIGYTFGSFYSPENGGLFGVFIALILWGILSVISYFSGSQILLSVSGAKEIQKEDHPQLYNVVEEMRIAANLPNMPKIYVIADPAPNAFATGIKPENSAITVTAGLLGTVNRDELQGVVAHEMSHIVNRDILLMTFAGIMLGAIVLMSEIFLRSLWFGGGSRYKSKSDRGGQGQIIIMIVALVLAILAPIMAQLLYFAISRRREYLADASAARLTRYPEGLASALEKISQSTYDLKTANKVTAPMYIVNPLKKKGMKLSDLTSTHPPITERIRILRAMHQGADLKSYQFAFNEIKKKNISIIPPSGLMESTAAIPIISPALENKTIIEPANQKREVGDLIMKMNNFRFIDCSCGLRIKIPPDYKGNTITCPRCGRVHDLSL